MAHRSIPPPDLPPAPTSVSASPPGWRSTVERVRERPSVVGLVVALVAAGAVGWWLLRPGSPPVESALPLASGEPAASDGAADAAGTTATSAGPATGSSTTTLPPLVVQAAGAVRSPGLYRLDPGARVDDLIRAAGGLTERADRDRVNLASPLADGQRVWLPERGEREAPPVVAGGSGTTSSAGSTGAPAGEAAGDGGTQPSDAPVDLNAADAEALDSLPGVGPATAQAILTHREESGPFRSVDDLLDVPGIGDAKLEQIRPHVTVG